MDKRRVQKMIYVKHYTRYNIVFVYYVIHKHNTTQHTTRAFLFLFFTFVFYFCFLLVSFKTLV